MKKKTHESNQEHGLKKKLVESSELPKDVLLGQPVLTILGHMEINIENYRGIIEYTDLLVRIQTKAGQIRIMGRNLRIDYYTNDDMKITGRIETIEYQT